MLPVCGIARRLAGDAAGWAAGLAVALYPALTAAVPLWGTMTEPLYLLLVAAAWWALLVALQEARLWGYAVAGAALALAYLTRTEALVYLVAGLGAAAADRAGDPGSDGAGGSGARPRQREVRDAPAGRHRAVWRTLAGLALAVAVFALVISPYLIALRAKTGQWQLAEEAGSTYVSAAGLARGDVAAFDRATWGLDAASGQVYLFAPSSESQGLLSAIAAEPRGFVRRLRSNLSDLLATTLSAQLIPLGLAVLAVLGLFARPWDARRLRGELLLIASLAGPLSFLPFFIQPRYLAGMLIPGWCGSAKGSAWSGVWLAGTWAALRAGGAEEPRGGGVEAQGSGGAGKAGGALASRLLKVTPALILALALLWLQPPMWASSLRTRSFQPGHLAAGVQLQALGVTAGTVVMSRYPAIAFHAGTRWAPTPAASWPEVEAYAQRNGVRFLAVDRWETESRPQLAPLLDPARAGGAGSRRDGGRRGQSRGDL